MLFGSSYSLIMDNVSKESYGFSVANFDVEFLDNTKITLSGIPVSDQEGLKTSKEFTFTVSNNSDYDVNYRLDIIENSVDIMSDVIKYSYSLNGSDYNRIYLLKNNSTINQNKVLKQNDKDIYKVKIWLSDEADESYMNKKFSASISLMATQNEYKYATNVIERLANDNLDDVKKVNNDYRYMGSNPNNYIWFNCKDGYTKGKDNCEMWRIIGSFDNAWEDGIGTYKSLKIVSSNVYDEVSFNNEDKNGDYDNSYITSFANGVYFDKLNKNAQELILNAKWNIGNLGNSDINNSYNNEIKKTSFANVGLLNVSDYMYLGENGWLISDQSILFINKSSDKVLILNNGIVEKESLDNYSFLPVVYLKPDVSIVSGNGSIDSPYEIKVKYPMNYGIIK